MSLTRNVLLKVSFAQERRRRSESEYVQPSSTDNDDASEAGNVTHNAINASENSFPIFRDNDDSVFSTPSRGGKDIVRKSIDDSPSKCDRENDSPEKENKSLG